MTRSHEPIHHLDTEGITILNMDQIEVQQPQLAQANLKRSLQHKKAPVRSQADRSLINYLELIAGSDLQRTSLHFDTVDLTPVQVNGNLSIDADMSELFSLDTLPQKVE